MNCWILLLAAVVSCYTVSDVSAQEAVRVGEQLAQAPVKVPAGTFINCTNDVKVCLDLTIHFRDPSNGCRFPKCPCPQDLHECPDGSFVPRNQYDYCRFYQCQGQCPYGGPTIDALCGGIAGIQCTNGMYCEMGFQPGIFDAGGWCCPEIIPCRETNELVCDDGIQDSRDISNLNCTILPCPQTCTNGNEPMGSCSLQDPCGYEQYCVYGTNFVTENSIGWCCPSDFWVKLCKYEQHIWRDYILFNEVHKDLITMIPTPGKAKIRVQMDKIYEAINCINELICKVNEKKTQIQDGQFNRNGIDMISCLWNWISKIWEKADQMEAAILKLRKFLKKNNQKVKLEQLSNLKASCLLEGFVRPHELALYGGHGIMMELIPVNLDDVVGEAAYDICKKAEELGLLYHEMLSKYGQIYGWISAIFQEFDSFGSIPAGWFNEKIKCVHDFAKLYYEMRQCCEDVALGRVKLNDLVKKIGAWLKKAMDIREKIRKCFPAKIAVPLKNAIIGIDKENADLAIRAVDLAAQVDDRCKDFFKKFDKCIIKMRCIFLELLKKFWRAPQ